MGRVSMSAVTRLSSLYTVHRSPTSVHVIFDVPTRGADSTHRELSCGAADRVPCLGRDVLFGFSHT